MGNTGTILTSVKGPVATISLNRPDVHHAINMVMIRELIRAITGFGESESIRIILLNAPGPNFSAGADLDWMRRGLNQGEEHLKKESSEMAGLFRIIWENPKVVVTAVQGNVLGGAIGLVAASDLVIAEEGAQFSFSEVKLGLVPATIAPFVVRKTGKSLASAWMLTGRAFTTAEARDGGLVHFVCGEGMLEGETNRLLKDLLANGPEAMVEVKQMLRELSPDEDPGKIQKETSEIIARFRASKEGQEGMNAFFDKRKPGWHETE